MGSRLYSFFLVFNAPTMECRHKGNRSTIPAGRKQKLACFKKNCRYSTWFSLLRAKKAAASSLRKSRTERSVLPQAMRGAPALPSAPYWLIRQSIPESQEKTFFNIGPAACRAACSVVSGAPGGAQRPRARPPGARLRVFSRADTLPAVAGNASFPPQGTPALRFCAAGKQGKSFSLSTAMQKSC